MAHEGVVPTHAQGEGDTNQVGSVGMLDEDCYGPWVVVTRKKSGSKGPNFGSTAASKAIKQERVNTLTRASTSKAKEDGLGLKRDGKRKAGLVASEKRINGPERVGQAGENVSKGDMLKTMANGSIRGKKGIARLKVFSNKEVTSSSSIGSLYLIFSLANIAQPNIDPNFRFSASLENEMGDQVSRERGGELDSRDCRAIRGSEGQAIGEVMCRDNVGTEQPVVQLGVRSFAGDRSELQVPQFERGNVGSVSDSFGGEGAAICVAQVDRMEFEEGCENPTSD